MSDDEDLGRLGALDTSVVSDALDRLSLAGAVTGLSLLTGALPVAGRVRTVRIEPVTQAWSAATPTHLGASAIDRSGPGDVIVVGNGGRSEAACWGGLLSAGAKRRGVAAVVLDGLCRDVDEAAEAGLTIVARGATPVSARGRYVEVHSGQPIRFADVDVAEGDYLLADRSGVVLVAAAQLGEVVQAAAALASEERQMAERIRAGEPVTQVMDRRYEQMLRSP